MFRFDQFVKQKSGFSRYLYFLLYQKYYLYIKKYKNLNLLPIFHYKITFINSQQRTHTHKLKMLFCSLKQVLNAIF